METEIYQNKISYNWEGGQNYELDDSDIEHIKEGIDNGFNRGQLCQTSKENGKVENIGWWFIIK